MSSRLKTDADDSSLSGRGTVVGLGDAPRGQTLAARHGDRLQQSPSLGGATRAIRPGRRDVVEGGAQFALGQRITMDSVYRKRSRGQQDNNNFFDTGIIFPTALVRVRVTGVERGRRCCPYVESLDRSASPRRVPSRPRHSRAGCFSGNTPWICSPPGALPHRSRPAAEPACDGRFRSVGAVELGATTRLRQRSRGQSLRSNGDRGRPRLCRPAALCDPHGGHAARAPAHDRGPCLGVRPHERPRPAHVDGAGPGHESDAPHRALQLPVFLRRQAPAGPAHHDGLPGAAVHRVSATGALLLIDGLAASQLSDWSCANDSRMVGAVPASMARRRN